MKTEVIKQYAHTWRTFAGIVKDFDDAPGFILERDYCPGPYSVSHLKATTYYLEDESTVLLAAGKPFDGNGKPWKRKTGPRKAI